MCAGQVEGESDRPGPDTVSLLCHPERESFPLLQHGGGDFMLETSFVPSIYLLGGMRQWGVCLRMEDKVSTDFSWPNHFSLKSVAGRPGVSINSPSGLRHGCGDLRASTTDSQGRMVRDSTEHRLTGRQFRCSRKQEPTMPGIVISCVRHN